MTLWRPPRIPWWRRVIWWFKPPKTPEFTKFVFPIIKKPWPMLTAAEVMGPREEQLSYDPDEGKAAIEFRGRAMGKTRYMLERALDQAEVAKEWPYVVRVATRVHAADLTNLMCKLAMERGMELVRRRPGTVVLKGGAEFHFVRREVWENWLRSREHFSDIVEDNERTTERIDPGVLEGPPPNAIFTMKIC